MKPLYPIIAAVAAGAGATLVSDKSAKQALILTAAAAGSYGLYLAISPEQKRGDEAGDKQTAQDKAQAQEIKALSNKGLKQSLPDFRYLQIADTIYSQLETSNFTDAGAAQAKGLMYYAANDIDALKLTQAYGYRQRYNFGLPTGSPENLATTLRAELPQSYIKELNALYAKRGMAYRI